MFIFPWIIGMAVFFLTNVIRSWRYAFNDIYIPRDGGGYVLIPRGIEHFRYALMSHPTFNREVIETITDLMWSVPLILFVSLFVAIMLNRKFAGRTVFRAIFFLPVVLAIPGIQGAFAVMNNMVMGGVTSGAEEAMGFGFNSLIFAQMLVELGMPINVVTYIVDAVARIHTVIRSGGVQMLIFLAALQAIPRPLYEVAYVEGATAYETFWKVTLPMVSPLILTNVVYTVVDQFALSSPVELAHATAFTDQNFGLASAFSIISALVICLFLLIVGFAVSRKVFYQV